jgi:hypothetical protein
VQWWVVGVANTEIDSDASDSVVGVWFDDAAIEFDRVLDEWRRRRAVRPSWSVSAIVTLRGEWAEGRSRMCSHRTADMATETHSSPWRFDSDIAAPHQTSTPNTRTIGTIKNRDARGQNVMSRGVGGEG